MKYALFAGYVLVVIAANVAIGLFGMVPVGFGLLAPAGVYFAGLAFTLRDGLQHYGDRRWVLAAIVLGAIISAFLSAQQLALASGIAFLCSELLDYAIYTPLSKRSWVAAVALSNTAGLVLDSVLFLYLAFGSLDFVTGQIVGKGWMTLAAVVLIAIYRAVRKQTAKQMQTA